MSDTGFNMARVVMALSGEMTPDQLRRAAATLDDLAAEYGQSQTDRDFFSEMSVNASRLADATEAQAESK